MQEFITLDAKYMFTIFRNEDNGYSVAKFITDDTKEEEFTATGILPILDQAKRYRLQGAYQEHSRYGMQFQVVKAELLAPNDESSLIHYFASDLFPGIGKKTAQQIVDVLGQDAIDKIMEDPTVLNQVSLNEKRRQIILKGVQEHQSIEDSVAFLAQFGIAVNTIAKIEATYGKAAVSTIKENPYQLIEDIDGIGFQTADKIAGQLMFTAEHPYRMKAAILAAVMDICMANGDTYVYPKQIQKQLHKDYDINIQNIDDILIELQGEGLLYVKDDRIYHHTQWEAEQGIAVFLANFSYEEQHVMDETVVASDICKVEEQLGITYEQHQKDAILRFFCEPFSIITGGPGTGKTTIVQGILKLTTSYYPEDVVSLCAPTGRASKRLSQLSDGNATTIHSLLKWDLESNTFTVNEMDPIQADVLIIDEFSMVDQWLFYNLLQASHMIKRILIIGDEDQLASVGPGSVLKDLIASSCFPLTRLEKIFRQEEGSDVVTLAHEIKEEQVTILNQAKDIAFFSCQNYEVRSIVNQVVENALLKGYDSKDIQVLVPMYQGVAGINALNNALQQMLNPADPDKKELKIGYRTFREEDKILQLKNQPEDHVSNGDIGKIKEIIYANEDIQEKNRLIADFDGQLVEYTGDALYHISHAYCISIHKSQGSEYPIVIMPIVKDYQFMLQKRLLYTGITRAKKSLILLGDRELFLHAVQVKDRYVRKSSLTEKILMYFE